MFQVPGSYKIIHIQCLLIYLVHIEYFYMFSI